MSDQTVVLRYIGEGWYIAGVPARDLTQADIEASGKTAEELLAFHPPVFERAPITAAPLVAGKRSKAT